MAQYQHLPIYKTAYELLQLVTRATSEFPKAYKYSLGDKLRGHGHIVALQNNRMFTERITI